MRKSFLTGLLTSLTLSLALAQSSKVAPFTTFSTTRNINSQSVETLKKKNLDFRVTHRFGDISGSDGGFHNWWGLDNSSDIRIAFEYGLSDNLMIGLGRSKGSGTVVEIIDGFIKYRVLTQGNEGGSPVSVTFVETSSATAMKASTDLASGANVDNFTKRLTYTSELLIARKFGSRFSAQLMPLFQHRNFVSSDDENNLLAVGFAGRMKMTKVFALSAEYFLVAGNDTRSGGVFSNPLSFGLEMDLGGHVFQIDLTNAKGIGENQFIPYTGSLWRDGQYRLGFTISRPFKL